MVEELKINSKFVDGSRSNSNKNKGFDPMSIDGITPRCICGFELIKESEDTFRCTGGNHRYHMSSALIETDKFGNTIIKFPIPKLNNKEEKVN